MAQVAQLQKYGVQTTIDFDLFEVDGVDFRVDAVHAAGDAAVMKDEGAEASTTNGFTDEGQGYSIVLTATEMQAARVVVYLVDLTATKVWLDKTIIIETYGNASAMHAVDLDDAVRAGLTALPNAAADAAGGLPVSDAGALDLDALDTQINAIEVDTQDLQGRLPAALVGGSIDATLDATGFEDAAVDKVWDEARADHVAAGSFGQMLQAVHGGTAQAGASGQITLAAAASATNDTYNGMVIQIIGGTDVGQSRLVLDYDGTTKVVTIVSTPDWDKNPSSDSVYVVHAYGAVNVQAWRNAQVQSLANSLVVVDVARWKAEIVPAPTTTGRPLVTVDATGLEDATFDKVWGEDVDAAHQTAGSAGKKLDDDDAADPWATALPGAYGQGSAGHLLGHLRLRSATVQAGAASSITLDAGASAADDFYNDAILQIVAGTGAGQSRIVADYVGASKVATVNGNWVVNPDATSVFAVYPFGAVPGATAPTAGQVTDAVWDEALAGHQGAGAAGLVLDTRLTGGAGALQKTLGLTVGGSPLEGASVWVATDAAGANLVAGPLVTSSQGEVTLLVDAGTFFAWVQKDGYDAVVAAQITVA